MPIPEKLSSGIDTPDTLKIGHWNDTTPCHEFDCLEGKLEISSAFNSDCIHLNKKDTLKLYNYLKRTLGK